MSTNNILNLTHALAAGNIEMVPLVEALRTLRRSPDGTRYSGVTVGRGVLLVNTEGGSEPLRFSFEQALDPHVPCFAREPEPTDEPDDDEANTVLPGDAGDTWS